MLHDFNDADAKLHANRLVVICITQTLLVWVETTIDAGDFAGITMYLCTWDLP